MRCPFRDGSGSKQTLSVPCMSGELRQQLLEIAGDIHAGRIEPRPGAARIWRLLAEANYPVGVEDFRAFAGAASEIQDHPEHSSAYEGDIRAIAADLVQRGGSSA